MARLVLFDLDGTLMRSHNGFIPFNQAIEKTFGFPGDIRTVIPDGNTDPVILEDIFSAANVKFDITVEQWEAFAENLHQWRYLSRTLPCRILPIPMLLLKRCCLAPWRRRLEIAGCNP
ncbi:MAG: HAD family hydrolase [Candidatus Binatia bacterium]